MERGLTSSCVRARCGVGSLRGGVEEKRRLEVHELEKISRWSWVGAGPLELLRGTQHYHVPMYLRKHTPALLVEPGSLQVTCTRERLPRLASDKASSTSRHLRVCFGIEDHNNLNANHKECLRLLKVCLDWQMGQFSVLTAF